MLGTVCEETSVAFENLVANGQLDLRCLLDVAHPLAFYVGGADVERVAVQNEPNRNFVGLPGLASIMGQPCGLLSRYPPQSRKFGRFHKLLENLNIPELFLGHTEVVPQFVHERLTDLVSDFCLARTDRFDVLLVKHDVGRTDR